MVTKCVVEPKEKHCGNCIYFESFKYGIYSCKLNHTVEEMFNYSGQIKENKNCVDHAEKGE